MSDIEMTPVPQDEEEVLNDIDENTTLRNEGKRKTRKNNWQALCCKAFIILVAVIVFLAILIRSWSDYGTYITKHVFPPSVHSMSVQCRESHETLFNTPTCSWNITKSSSSMTCDLDKPSKWVVDYTRRDIGHLAWDDKLIIDWSEIINCTHLIIWSI